LLPQAVNWLSAGWTGSGPLDLSRLLVIVPTRQSGRRLREALAEAAAVRGQGVFAPRVATPETLLALAPAVDAAPRLVSLLAWAGVLDGLDLGEFRAVIPVDPPVRNFGWALRLGREFSRLQAALAEAGLTMGEVTSRAGPGFPEASRWEALGRLEALHARRLAQVGLRDSQVVKIGLARHSPRPDFDRIVVMATPDPMPLAVDALAAHARTMPVDVVVFAPPEEAANFDLWGRPGAAPHAEGWGGRVIALPEFERRVRLCADPAAQAEAVAAIAGSGALAAGQLGLGVADTEVLAPLERALARAGVPAYNPEGRPRRQDALHGLLAALAAFAAGPDFAAMAGLVRCPDVLTWLGSRLGAGFSAAQLLAALDSLHADHLPPTLAAAQAQARDFPPLAPALDALEELHGLLTRGDFPANAAAALAEIFGARRIDAGGTLADSAGTWVATLREAGRAFACFPDLRPAPAEAWEFALEEFAGTVRPADRPIGGALDLSGWLELLWEDAPHLVVTGFNEGKVPDAVVGDAFLPEALRVRLGLKTNAARFARDAYLLSALAASRVESGRLELLFGRTSAAGEPLRPSRLLLRCADAELPARVTGLFRSLPPVRPGLPWSRAWRLQPPRVAPAARLSVTALRDWLHCPFRFYLRHVLGMREVDLVKDELDAGDFGTLLHGALQQLGEHAALRDCPEAGPLAEFLLQRFEQAAWARYGTELTLPLLVQFESARQRLRAAAAVEARERAAGWRTERVEWKFSLPLGGLELRGKIDRIDRHPDGRVRILDYKTGDTGRTPDGAHLRSPRAADADRPGWMLCPDTGGRPRVWVDLQLPLYRRAVGAEWGAAVACGYFNLPKAAGGTAVSLWDEYTPELQAAAEHCAEEAARAVAAGRFWPPAEPLGREAAWDEFAPLFHGGTAASVDVGGPA
jgi:ATP-dependent helicase/nuclease subunit B